MKCGIGSAADFPMESSSSSACPISSSDLLSGGMYFTRVDVLPEKFNIDAFSLSDILQIIRPQLSIHFNFMIDLEWMIQQYPAPCRNCPIICVVGEKMGTDKRSLQREVDINKWNNISVVGASLPIPFGTHHAKLSIFECEKRLHVIVSTANLVEGDWDQKTQCFYYASGLFSDGSVTSDNEFVNDLCDYLAEYRLSDVTYWIDRIRNSDFTGISDRLVFSVPGYHKNSRMGKFGHLSLLRHLQDRPEPKQNARRLFLAQCSSIGSLGDKREAWLLPQFLNSLQGGKNLVFSRLFVIYPCVDDVRHSLEGYSAGDSLPYQESTSRRQPWIREIMCKWRSERRGRSKAMPHVKTYTEIVDGVPQWLLVTSANLSKAAWGELQKNKSQLMVRSYELGVLITDPARIKLPYDYPVAKYGQKDNPWICDVSYTEADSHGKQWIMCSSSFRGEKDRKVLSYGDIVLYQSDVNTLLPEVWLNDNVISFACEFLMDNATKEVKQQVAVIGAASSELIRYANDDSIICEIFTSLCFFNKEKILFILNDREDPTVVGGFHWSLLVLERRAAHFRLYDSTRPAKVAIAKQLVNIVSQFLDAEDVKFTIEDCPQQNNSFDCGMYVIEFVRRALKCADVEVLSNIDDKYIEMERRFWLDIINSLATDSKHQSLII